MERRRRHEQGDDPLKLEWKTENGIDVASINMYGKRFFATYEHKNAAHNRRAKIEATKDLRWYIEDFYFGGCGAAEHVFEDVPLPREKGEEEVTWKNRRRLWLVDRGVSSKCTRCGVTKKANMFWPTVLGERNLIQRACEVNGLGAVWEKFAPPA